jgi:ubiquinone/menaquinone biosynthesis C-methylase UbiE
MTVWVAQQYGDNTAHHRRFDESLLAGWTLPKTGQVLDIGCGVGDFTVQLVGAGRTVLGVDPSPALISDARARFGDQVRFRVASAQHLDGVLDSSIEAVVSRSALHWVPADDHAQVLREVARVLSPNGLFRAEFAAAGQMPDVRRILDSELAQRGLRHAPWYFADPDEYATLITSAGLTTAQGWLRSVAQRRLYSRDEVLGWLSSQIVIAYESLMNKGEFASFCDEVSRRCLAELERESDRYAVEFRRLDVLACRA